MQRHIVTTFATLLCKSIICGTQLFVSWWSLQQCIVEVNDIVKTLDYCCCVSMQKGERETFQALALLSNVSCIVTKSKLTVETTVVD